MLAKEFIEVMANFVPVFDVPKGELTLLLKLGLVTL